MGPQGFGGGGSYMVVLAVSERVASAWRISSRSSETFSADVSVAAVSAVRPADVPRQHVNKGTDLRITVKVTLKDIMNGVDKSLRFRNFVADPACKGTGAKDGTAFGTCPRCHGSGYISTVQQTIMGPMESHSVCPECNGEGKIITEQCPHCHGEGVEKKEEIVSFHIPAGVENDMVLTIRGQGNAPRHGGVNGDLLIVIQEEKDADLIREGMT